MSAQTKSPALIETAQTLVVEDGNDLDLAHFRQALERGEKAEAD